MCENVTNESIVDLSNRSRDVNETKSNFADSGQKEHKKMNINTDADLFTDFGNLMANNQISTKNGYKGIIPNAMIGPKQLSRKNKDKPDLNQNADPFSNNNLSNNDSTMQLVPIDYDEKNLPPDSSHIFNQNHSEKVDIFKIDESDEDTKNNHPIILSIIENIYFQILVFIFILWALFARDIQLLAFPSSVDVGFSIVTIIAFFVFSIEIILTAIAQPEYRFSFFFWLDWLSTITLIFDIVWINSLMFNQETDDSTQLVRAGRASRIGARAGRIVRIVRLIKVINLAKVRQEKKRRQSAHNKSGSVSNFETGIPNEVELQNMNTGKNGNEIQNNANNDTKITLNQIKNGDEVIANTLQSGTLDSTRKIPKRRSKVLEPNTELDENNLKESKIGKKLIEITTIRVVLIVLLLIIICPLFTIDFFLVPDVSTDYLVQEIADIFQANPTNSTLQNSTYWSFIQLQSNAGYPIIYMNLNGMQYTTNTSPNDLRIEEKHISTVNSVGSSTYTSTIDLRYVVKLECGLSIGRTLFICLMLLLGSFIFSYDINNLIIKPMERMLNKINSIANNPLSVKDQALTKDKKLVKQNEIVRIENAVIKINTLLVLGFGEAGTQIISSNLSNGGGDVNPMIPGKKIYAIFGFCDIRNFTDATEVLQEEVMVFVNSIANIVHRYVDKYTGAANKNIGDAFLLVWKFPELAIIKSEIDQSLELGNSLIVQNIVDLSLISFLKIYARINKDPVLFRYRDDPRLNSRLPDYKVRMGFGLHCGWAIEGAIGSEFKIDASYLSPNVNMASRLEAATKQYGVSILFSGDLAAKLSQETRDRCRLIDIVTVKGSEKPSEIWTIDTQIADLGIAKPSVHSKLEKKIIQSEKKMDIEELFINANEKASGLFDSDKDLLSMIEPKTSPFYTLFDEGFNAYREGNWGLAKTKFNSCIVIRPSDGPTKTLYNVLKEKDFQASENWKGYRELTEKQ